MTPVTPFVRWARTHPRAMDAALAAAVLLCMIAASFVDPNGGRDGTPMWGTRSPQVLSVVLMVLGAAALVLRRRAPMAVLAATSAVTLAELVTGDPRAPVAMSAVVALYTVAATTDRPTTWRVGLATMAVLTGAAMLAGPLPWYAQENLGVFAWTGMAAATGDAVREAGARSSTRSASGPSGPSAPGRRRPGAGSPRSACASPATCTTSSRTTSLWSTSRRASPRTSWTSAPTRPRRPCRTCARRAAPRSTNSAPPWAC